jgi:BRCT domain type II-containing protein
MSNLSNVLNQLRAERNRAQQEVEHLDNAISAIQRLVGRNGSVTTPKGSRPRRNMSPSARRRIADAQKATWAKWHQQHGQAAKVNVKAPVTRTFSAATRRRMAAAQRARWAKKAA